MTGPWFLPFHRFSRTGFSQPFFSSVGPNLNDILDSGSHLSQYTLDQAALLPLLFWFTTFCMASPANCCRSDVVVRCSQGAVGAPLFCWWLTGLALLVLRITVVWQIQSAFSWSRAAGWITTPYRRRWLLWMGVVVLNVLASVLVAHTCWPLRAAY